MVHLAQRAFLAKWDNRAMWGPIGASYGGLDGMSADREAPEEPA